MSSDVVRKGSLLAGIGCVAALGWSLASYRPLPATIAAILAVVLLTMAARRKVIRFLAGSALGGGVLWAAFHTTEGYFWLNRFRLEALVAEIAEVPAIASLGLGQDNRVSARDRRSTSRPEVFDSYRFINAVAVTHYRRQVAPDAHQPVFHVEDLLRQLNVPAARYWALRAGLERLSLSGFSRLPGGEIMLDEPVVGGTPWGFSFVFSPTDTVQRALSWQDFWKLAPRWYYVGLG